uniref:dedicator of cytokinesis protein 1-like n=1 Tax=Myxine glutinosa TaxID=7769 RepID=UPI00358F3F9F
MGIWKPTEEAKFGVATYNFKAAGPHQISLQVGDTVHIFEECEGWYHGVIRHSEQKGIFPVSFIALKKANVVNPGPEETIIPCTPHLLQEITATLREWGNICLMHYVNGGVERIMQDRSRLNKLLNWRTQLLSGSLPTDEVFSIQQTVTSTIDYGNKMLGLDLVVRDKDGVALDPDCTSTISLYQAHCDSTTRLATVEEQAINIDIVDTSSGGSNAVGFPNFSLFLLLKNFVCKIGEEAELCMGLYDGQESAFISENYVVRWGQQGLPKQLELLNNMHVLFTDLGPRDMNREHIYLVCNIVRVGRMDLRETTHKKHTTGLRRPFGVCVMDITDIVRGIVETDEERQHFIPFQPITSESDCLHNVIQRAVAAKDINHKGQGLWVSLKRLSGDASQARREFPHLIDRSMVHARKLGFPDLIMPGDVRNDVYVTLLSGDFERGAGKSYSLQVTVKACDDQGNQLKNVFWIGVGDHALTEYKSVVYYQLKQLRWAETIKVVIPVELVGKAHLHFSFRHRSTQDARDKSEKPFAMAYVQLMRADGTTMQDGEHELIVYRCDSRKLEDHTLYLNMPATRVEAESGGQGRTNGALTPSIRDHFVVSLLFCSTKLTQNVDLLGLLKWRSNPDLLESNLKSLHQVDGGEVVKFLQDTLDALFNIMMETSDSDRYDILVFDALIYVISLVTDRKFRQFNPVLEAYAGQHFSATLAYIKLTKVLKDKMEQSQESHDNLLQIMKSLEYIVRFIVVSRTLYAQLNEGKGKKEFENSIQELFSAMTKMMAFPSTEMLGVQGAALRSLSRVIPDMVKVMDPVCVSMLLRDAISSVPPEKLVRQKHICWLDIVRNDIFKNCECRDILLSEVIKQLQTWLGNNVEHDDTARLLGDLLEMLHDNSMPHVYQHIQEVMVTLLRTLNQAIIAMDRGTESFRHFVACMTAILRQMDDRHYQFYIETFKTRADLMDFLMETFLLFKDLISRNVYPADWVLMHMTQNRVFLRAICQFADILNQKFLDDSSFELQLWNNYFHLAVAFLTQESLQLENFFPTKWKKIMSKYGDMRLQIGSRICENWYNLGQHKIRFVPGMIGPILEMTLVPETGLRKRTIPIFFDMMQCEFHYMRDFKKFENELITKLDLEVEGGHGDEEYRRLFETILASCCRRHKYLAQSGGAFVEVVSRLLERLLDYRSITSEENKDNKDGRMICTVNLLNFYKEIGREEMYFRYLHKLADMHLECENYTEAGYTLLLRAQHLKWLDEPYTGPVLPHHVVEANTHWELKGKLFQDVIGYFDKGKMWEEAIVLCKELAEQYEMEVFDYEQLSTVLRKEATLYESMVQQPRPWPDYVAIGCYGNGFPTFLRNKVFIHRGRVYERREELEERLSAIFPHAENMKSSGDPGEEIRNSPGKHLQCLPVQPIMEDLRLFKGKAVPEILLSYYKANAVQKFTYSRPFRRGEKDPDNEFATMWIEQTTYITAFRLPNMIHWSEVKSTSVMELSPLENAISTMSAANSELQVLLEQHQADPRRPLHPLALRLNGMVDPAVMGGLSNYEKAFFNEKYELEHPEDKVKIEKLKDLIAWQIPFLEVGVRLHGKRVSADLRPFHDRLTICFAELKGKVERQYGVRILPHLEDKRGGARQSKVLSFCFPSPGTSQSPSSPATMTSTAASSPAAQIPSKASHSTPLSSPGPPVMPKPRSESVFGTLRKLSLSAVLVGDQSSACRNSGSDQDVQKTSTSGATSKGAHNTGGETGVPRKSVVPTIASAPDLPTVFQSEKQDETLTSTSCAKGSSESALNRQRSMQIKQTLNQLKATSESPPKHPSREHQS